MKFLNLFFLKQLCCVSVLLASSVLLHWGPYSTVPNSTLSFIFFSASITFRVTLDLYYYQKLQVMSYLKMFPTNAVTATAAISEIKTNLFKKAFVCDCLELTLASWVRSYLRRFLIAEEYRLCRFVYFYFFRWLGNSFRKLTCEGISIKVTSCLHLILIPTAQNLSLSFHASFVRVKFDFRKRPYEDFKMIAKVWA